MSDVTTSGWTVIDRDAGVLSREYTFGKNGEARTFVARMGDGRLLVVSPSVGSSDEAAAELAEFGEVGAILAPNGFHHLGIAEWRERFPEATVHAPDEAITRIGKKSRTAGELRPLSELRSRLGDRIGVHQVENTKAGESWVWAAIDGGHAFFTSDVLANMAALPPFPVSLLFRMTRSAPGYRVFGLALKVITRDPKATLRAFQEDTERHPVACIVPGHGAILHETGIADRTRELLQAAV